MIFVAFKNLLFLIKYSKCTKNSTQFTYIIHQNETVQELRQIEVD